MPLAVRTEHFGYRTMQRIAILYVSSGVIGERRFRSVVEQIYSLAR
jgi:hypothetical protein